MSLARLWRTMRHLGAEQLAFQLERRARRRLVRILPGVARSRVERRAAALPVPDLDAPALRAVAETVAESHGETRDDIAAGRFTLMNRAFDFGAPDRIDWRGDFGDGDNPLRRMTLSYMGAAVPALAGGRLDATAAMLASLERDNPWPVPGVLRDVWNPYAASHRLINLLSGLALHRANGGAAGTGAEGAILDHIGRCAAFVRGNLERDLQFNHLMKNLVALSVHGAGLRRPPASLAFLGEAVARSVRQCVLSDGGHVERSPMYHKLALVDLRLLRRSALFGATLDEAIARMESALAAMCHPDGDIALFNDSWLGEGPAASALVDTGAIGEIARLDDTGYVRLGRGGDVVLFDRGACGPDATPAHAHADFLSIEASVAGTRLIVDPGVPSYTAGPERDFARSAAAHNGPAVDGIEPLELWGSFRVGRRARAEAIEDAALDGFAPLWCAGRLDTGSGVSMRRFVGLWPGSGLLICDAWSGAKQAVRSTFLVAGDWRLAGDEPPIFASDAAEIRVVALAGTIEPVGPGRHWPRFDVEQPAHRITVRPETRDGRRRAALWWSWGGSAEPPGAPEVDLLLDRLAGPG